MFSTLRRHVAREAVATAFAAFALRHPSYVAALFDEHFLQSRVTPLLAVPEAVTIMTPQWLANAWAVQFNQDKDSFEKAAAAALPAATDFISLLEQALLPMAGLVPQTPLYEEATL